MYVESIIEARSCNHCCSGRATSITYWERERKCVCVCVCVVQYAMRMRHIAICVVPYSTSGPDSSVGIATGYGLDGPRIESRWGGKIFRTCPDRRWGPLSLLYNGYRVFPGGKERPGRDADPSPPSSAMVMKEQSYTSTPPHGPYSLYRASVPVQGCTLPLPFYLLYNIIPHYLTKARFSKKKSYWTKNVFWFLLRLSETFFILMRSELDMIKNVYWSSV